MGFTGDETTGCQTGLLFVGAIMHSAAGELRLSQGTPAQFHKEGTGAVDLLFQRATLWADVLHSIRTGVAPLGTAIKRRRSKEFGPSSFPYTNFSLLRVAKSHSARLKFSFCGVTVSRPLALTVPPRR
eukprot:EG_transcript_34806